MRALPPSPDLLVPTSITELFLSHGIIGAVALGALSVAVYLYKAKERAAEALETQRERAAAAHDAQRDKYELIIQNLQEDRIKEMRAGMTEIGKAIETVESTNKKFETVFELMMRRSHEPH